MSLPDDLKAKLEPRIYGPTDPGAFADTLQGSAPLVLMVHGDAERPESCVLSRAGYGVLLHGDQAGHWLGHA